LRGPFDCRVHSLAPNPHRRPRRIVCPKRIEPGRIEVDVQLPVEILIDGGVESVLLRAHRRASAAQLFAHRGRACRIRRREVTPFTHVRVEVEELDRFVPLIVIMLDKFPFAVAHGSGRTASLVRVVRQMPVEHARCGRRAGSKQLRLAHAVKFACRRCRPGELEERWKPVAVNERVSMTR
jgi:hypothetical protein